MPYHGNLYPLFVVSPKVDAKLIDEFLETAKNELELPYDEVDPYCFSIQRTFDDAKKELDRTTGDAEWAYGAKPPTTANEKLDFKGYKVEELAEYVLRNFSKSRNDGPSNTYHEDYMPIDNQYFVIMDDRTAEDRTVLVVDIPFQKHEKDDGSVFYTNKWVKRDAYNNNEGWRDGSDEEEITTARTRFGMARHIEMIKEGLGDIRATCIMYERAEEDGVSQHWCESL